MANYRILTNNPAVREQYPETADFRPGGVLDIFTAARDAVHQGAVLISHPLAGSIKPNESPYRSVMLSARHGPVNLDSLSVIEDALAVLAKLPDRQRSYTDRMLRDFQVIDLDLMRSAMQALPTAYH